MTTIEGFSALGFELQVLRSTLNRNTRPSGDELRNACDRLEVLDFEVRDGGGDSELALQQQEQFHECERVQHPGLEQIDVGRRHVDVQGGAEQLADAAAQAAEIGHLKSEQP